MSGDGGGWGGGGEAEREGSGAHRSNDVHKHVELLPCRPLQLNFRGGPNKRSALWMRSAWGEVGYVETLTVRFGGHQTRHEEMLRLTTLPEPHHEFGEAQQCEPQTNIKGGRAVPNYG